MLGQVRTRTDHAHLAAQHVEELRELVDAQFTEPAARRKNPVIVRRGLPRHVVVVHRHGAKLDDVEILVLQAGAGLAVKNGAGRLPPLEEPDDEGEHGQDEDDHRQGDGDVDDALEETVERILQRLVAQAEELEAVVLKIADRMINFLLEIVGDEQAHAEFFAGGGHVVEHVREHGELDEDDLGDFVFADDAFKIIRAAEHRKPGLEAA